MNFQMKISQEKKNKKLDIIWRWAMFNMASLSLLSLFPLIHVFKWTYGQTSDGQTYNSLHHSFTLNKIPSQFLKEENSFTLARVELFSPKTKKQKKTKMIISNFFFDWVQVRAYRNQKKKQQKTQQGAPSSCSQFCGRCCILFLRFISSSVVVICCGGLCSFIVGRCRRLSVGSAVIGHSVQPVCGFTGRKLQTEKKE
jgi:hypothetical protein